MGFDIDDKGVLKEVIYDSTRKYQKTIDVKDFYKKMAKFFQSEDFIDAWEYGSPAPPTEPPNKKTTRTGNMYEITFFYADRLSSGKEYDIIWKGKKEISEHGTLYFNLNFVNRVSFDEDIIINGKKKKGQSGTWEFMIKFEYKNTFGTKLKNSWIGKLKLLNAVDIFYNILYKNRIETDIEECEKIVNKFWSFVERELS